MGSKGNKRFKSKSLANFCRRTSIDTFTKEANVLKVRNLPMFVSNHTVAYTITFFLGDEVFVRPVIPFGVLCLYFPLIAQGINRTWQD